MVPCPAGCRHCGAVPLSPIPMFPSISLVVVDVQVLVGFVDVEGVIVIVVVGVGRM